MMYKVLSYRGNKVFSFYRNISCRNHHDKNWYQELMRNQTDKQNQLIKIQTIPNPGDTGYKNTWVCAAWRFSLAGCLHITGPELHTAVWPPCASLPTITRPPSCRLLPPCGAAGRPGSPLACSEAACRWPATSLLLDSTRLSKSACWRSETTPPQSDFHRPGTGTCGCWRGDTS